MVLIDTSKIESKEAYVQSLSKRAKHEYGLTEKRNRGVILEQVPFNEDEVRRFMAIWERQLVRGKPIQWAYPIETVKDWADKGELLLFQAKKKDQVIGMHFLKKEDGFWEAQPPMWDKALFVEKHLGTWFWFHVIIYAIEHNLGIINLGGGIDTSWREMIRRRKEFKNPLYKWRFIPRYVKQHPEEQPDYCIESFYGKRNIRENN